MLIKLLYLTFMVMLPMIEAQIGTPSGIFLIGGAATSGMLASIFVFSGIVTTVEATQANDNSCLPRLTCPEAMSWAFWKSVNISCTSNGNDGIFPPRFRDGVEKFNCTCAPGPFCTSLDYEKEASGLGNRIHDYSMVGDQETLERRMPLRAASDAYEPNTSTFRVGRSVDQDQCIRPCPKKCPTGTHCCWGECIIDTVACSQPASLAAATGTLDTKPCQSTFMDAAPLKQKRDQDDSGILCTTKCPKGYFCCEEGCQKIGVPCYRAGPWFVPNDVVDTTSGQRHSSMESEPQASSHHALAPGLAPALRDIGGLDQFNYSPGTVKDDNDQADHLLHRDEVIPELPVGTDLPSSNPFVVHAASVTTATMMTTVDMTPATTGTPGSTSFTIVTTSTSTITPTTTFTNFVTGFVSEDGSSEHVVMTNAKVNTDPHMSMVIDLTLVDMTALTTNANTPAASASTTAPSSYPANSSTTVADGSIDTASNAAAGATTGATGADSITTTITAASTTTATATVMATSSSTVEYCFDAHMQTKAICTSLTGTINTSSAGATDANASYTGMSAPINSITVGRAACLTPVVSILSLLAVALFL